MCAIAAACSGASSSSPTSPTGAAFDVRQTQSGTELPFNGSLTATEIDVVEPPTLFADGTAAGTANHLGLYTATFTAVVDLGTGTATGTYTFTATNGDQVFATFSGQGVPLGSGRASITETATIESGTGRFTAATGTFTIRRILDQATGQSSGSFAGHISLNN
jgi:hypothetical protein